MNRENLLEVNALTTAILGDSISNNKSKNITGVLYYSNGLFFQCLEGPKAALRKLIERITKDHRHADVFILFNHPISTRIFESWAMKLVQPDASLDETIDAVFKALKAGIPVSTAQRTQLLNAMRVLSHA